MLSPVLVALRCGHRSRGTGPQVILSPCFLRGLLHCLEEGGFAGEFRHGVVGKSFGMVGKCLASDSGFAVSAVGKSGNLRFLSCKAGMVLVSPTWGLWEEQM